MMNRQDYVKYRFPDSPGVYLFRSGNIILYIGKAASLKNRIRSYFSNNLINTRGPLLVDMLYKASKIEYIKTDSVLEALILEANLIKKHSPKYNTKEKDNSSFNYVIITDEDFPRVLVVREREIRLGLTYKIKKEFGPYTNGEALKSALKIIRGIFPFRDKCGLNKSRPCFNYQIGLCAGTCSRLVSQKDYHKIIKKIILLLSGKMNSLKSSLKKEMKLCSDKMEFEMANKIKKTIFALNHIQDVALIKEEHYNSDLQNDNTLSVKVKKNSFRIEAYDVAHLSGTSNVGVMVVMENGMLKKSDYRKFTIQNSKGNDLGALSEILDRRLKHQDWIFPDIIVVDGGLAQLNIAKKSINQTNTKVNIIAVTKDNKHKAKAIMGEENLVYKYKKEILLINNEAHRFAIKFHKDKRSKSFLR